MAESKAASEVLTEIREVLQSYLMFSEENPEQDPGFVIRHLSKVFDSTSPNFEDGNEEASTLLTKVQKLYAAYKLLSKWADDAPQILVQNLRKILFPTWVQKIPEVNSNGLVVVPAPSALNIYAESNYNLFRPEPQAIEFPGFPSDQSQSKDFSEYSKFQAIEDEPLLLEPPSPSFSEECPPPVLQRFEPVHEHQIEKGNPKPLHSFNVFCKFCKKSFNRISNKILHERSCSKPFKFGLGLGLVKPKLPVSFTKSNSNVNVKTKVKTNLITSASSSKTVPNKNQQQKTTVVPNSGASTGFVPNPELIKQVILGATKNTLESSGWNRKNPAKRKSKILDCHLCNHGNKYNTSDILANHIRLHTKERPFSCLHPFCSATFSDSLNYRKHVKRPHGENGALIRIRQGTSKSLGILKKSKLKALSGKKKLNLNSKGNGEFGKSLKLFEKDETVYKSDDDDDDEDEMLWDDNDADADYRPSFSNSSSHASRRRKRKRNGTGSFPCRFCGRLFGQSGHRADHVKLKHTREGLFFCSICGYGALSQHKLDLHMTGHNGLDCPFQCHFCDRRFKTQLGRSTHEKVFCLEKPTN